VGKRPQIGTPNPHRRCSHTAPQQRLLAFPIGTMHLLVRMAPEFGANQLGRIVAAKS